MKGENFLELFKSKSKCPTTQLSDISQDQRGFLPTGILPLDYVIGAPGFPLGRIVEIYGLESVGKSAIIACLLGFAQQLGGVAALADTEHAYTNDWARLFSINPDELLILGPEHIQQATESFQALIKIFIDKDAPSPRIIAWDSIAATPLLEEVDDDLSDKSLGLHARLLSKGLRELTNLIETSNLLFIAANQQKEKIGLFKGGGVTKIGGHAFDFHCSIQLRLKRISLIPNPVDKSSVGMTIQITAVKNKIFRPYLSSTVKYYFDSGFDDTEFVTWFASQIGILEEKGGGWKVFKGVNFQNKDIPNEIWVELEKIVIETYYGPYANSVLQIRELRRNQAVLQPHWQLRGLTTNEDGFSKQDGTTDSLPRKEVVDPVETLPS